MTGAIHMEERVAVIDPLSCMTCHECVDVCDWGALDWTTAPRVIQPKRVKKGVEIALPPHWQALTDPVTPVWQARLRRQRRWLLAFGHLSGLVPVGDRRRGRRSRTSIGPRRLPGVPWPSRARLP